MNFYLKCVSPPNPVSAEGEALRAGRPSSVTGARPWQGWESGGGARASAWGGRGFRVGPLTADLSQQVVQGTESRVRAVACPGVTSWRGEAHSCFTLLSPGATWLPW